MSVKADDILAGAVVVGFVGLMLAGVAGWVLNIVKIAGALSEPLTLLLVFRLLGVIALPIGCVLGWV